MALKLANNAAARLAVGISDVDTTIVVMPGHGNKFPALDPGDWFPVTAVRADGALEIMYCTARSGDVLTVERGKEGTIPAVFNANDKFELRATAGVYATFMPREISEIDGPLAINGTLQTKNASTPSVGRLELGNSGTRFIEWDGSNYALGGAGAIWHTGNFDPDDKADLSGANFTGPVVSQPMDVEMAFWKDAAPFYVQNNGGSGDTGLAAMCFIAPGSYGIMLGLRADGVFGLGGYSRNPWSFYSDHDGNFVAAGNVTAYSDPRLKEDIEPIKDALAILSQLDGVRFKWNGKTRLIGRPGERDIGVLADQVEAVLPEIVGRSVPDDENGGERWRMVAYDKLVPVLIEAVKSLHGRVAALEAKQ